jgi:hypothetical protein
VACVVFTCGHILLLTIVDMWPHLDKTVPRVGNNPPFCPPPPPGEAGSPGASRTSWCSACALSPFGGGLFNVGAAPCVYATERDGGGPGQHYLLDKESGSAD